MDSGAAKFANDRGRHQLPAELTGGGSDGFQSVGLSGVPVGSGEIRDVGLDAAYSHGDVTCRPGKTSTLRRAGYLCRGVLLRLLPGGQGAAGVSPVVPCAYWVWRR